MNGGIKVLLGLAAVGVVGLVVSSIRESAVNSGLRQARDSLFEVSADCKTISFKGGGDGPDPEKLELAKEYYFDPFVREHLGEAHLEAELLGMTVSEFMTAKVLYDLFPECAAADKQPWPPESVWTSGAFGVIWVAMHAYIGNLISEQEGA